VGVNVAWLVSGQLVAIQMRCGPRRRPLVPQHNPAASLHLQHPFRQGNDRVVPDVASAGVEAHDDLRSRPHNMQCRWMEVGSEGRRRARGLDVG
jgi:hypothetical protein